MITTPATTRRIKGFTLLEIIIAVLLLSLVVGMVFGIARSSLALGNSVVETQNEEMLHQAFIDLLTNRFSSLPGNTRFDLQVKDVGGRYLSELTLQNVPLTFTWGGQPRVAKAVQLVTVPRRTGFLSIVLRYFENEILEDSATTGKKTLADNEPFAEIELLDDMAFFEWRLLDGRSMDWQYDWDIQARLPLQLELVMSFGARGGELRHIFWIPPKQNPEVVLRQNLQNQNSQPATTPPVPGQPNQPGGGGNINIGPIPTPGTPPGGKGSTPKR